MRRPGPGTREACLVVSVRLDRVAIRWWRGVVVLLHLVLVVTADVAADVQGALRIGTDTMRLTSGCGPSFLKVVDSGEIVGAGRCHLPREVWCPLPQVAGLVSHLVVLRRLLGPGDAKLYVDVDLRASPAVLG